MLGAPPTPAGPCPHPVALAAVPPSLAQPSWEEAGRDPQLRSVQKAQSGEGPSTQNTRSPTPRGPPLCCSAPGQLGGAACKASESGRWAQSAEGPRAPRPPPARALLSTGAGSGLGPPRPGRAWGGAGGAKWMLTLHPTSLHPVGLSLPMRTLRGPCPEQPREGQTGTRLLQPQVGGERGQESQGRWVRATWDPPGDHISGGNPGRG